MHIVLAIVLAIVLPIVLPIGVPIGLPIGYCLFIVSFDLVSLRHCVIAQDIQAAAGDPAE